MVNVVTGEYFISSKCIACKRIKEKNAIGGNCQFYYKCFGAKYPFVDKTNVDINNIARFKEAE